MAYIVPDWSEVTDLEEIRKICEQVKDPVEKHTGKNYEVFQPISCRSQVVFQYVNGRNYLIKTYVGKENYIHVMVFQPLLPPGREIEFSGVQENKTRGDFLVPFYN